MTDWLSYIIVVIITMIFTIIFTEKSIKRRITSEGILFTGNRCVLKSGYGRLTS